MGFTLVELLVVVAIVGTLAAILIPTYNHYIDKARIAVAYGTLTTVQKALEVYNIDHQEYPPEPIDFLVGTDSMGHTVFQPLLLAQINNDISPVSYSSTGITFILVVKAKDSEQTLIFMTPHGITL